MGSFISTFERVMMPFAGKISGNKYLLAMRDAFSMLLPFIRINRLVRMKSGSCASCLISCLPNETS